jgi:hypothetical protein
MATKLVIDCNTGIEALVELTPEEVLEIEQARAEAQVALEQEALAAEAKAAAKASAEAKLAALGLTAEEIATL